VFEIMILMYYSNQFIIFGEVWIDKQRLW